MAETIEAPIKSDIPSPGDPLAGLTAKRNAAKAKNTPPAEKPAEEKPAEGAKPPEGVTKPIEEKPKEETKPAEGAKAEEKPAAPKKEKFTKHWETKNPVDGKPAEGEKSKEGQSAEKPAESTLSKQEKEELASLRALINKPSVKKILQAEESGKDFDTYYDELKSRDPYKMSYPDLYKKQLQDQGLSEAEITRKMDRFAEFDEDDQLDRVATFRKQLKETFDKELTDWTPKVEKPVDLWAELDEPYKQVAKKFENTKLFGVTATPEMVKAVADFHKNNSLIKLNEKGQLDPEDLFKKTFLLKNIDIIFDNAYEGGYNDGFEKSEEANGVGKPLPSQNGAGAPQPKSDEAKSAKEKQIANLKASLPKA